MSMRLTSRNPVVLGWVLTGALVVPGADRAAAGTGETPAPRKVAILLFDGTELLDFAGPGEVFQAAGRAFQVYTVAERAEPIVSQTFVRVVPEYSIDTAPRPDILVIPGGNTAALQGSARMMEWITRSARGAEVTLTVCTGAFVLAKAGLLDGLDATTWHGAIDPLRKAAPKTEVHENVRFVDNGRFVTTAGVSAGIDGALHVVARLLGEEAARSTARYMEYDKWEPRAGLIADAGLRETLRMAASERQAAEERSAVAATRQDGVQVVTITVTDEGYSPAVVRLAPGIPARLVFDRRTPSRCFEEVRIRDLGLDPVATPYGQQTAIDFVPQSEGRFGFACGMDMFRGTLLVRK